MSAHACRILKRTRALIARPANWTRHEFARNAADGRVGASSPTAVSWCSIGAIGRASDEGFDPTALRALRDEMDDNITAFNDERSHADVLAAFDRAIAKLEAQGGS